jgi:hypothetical protein
MIPKKLIWEYSDSENCHIAITKYVKYYLHKKFDSNKNQYFNIEVYSYDRYFLLSNKKSKSYIFDDLEMAKEICQEDFNNFILSNLN